MVPENPNYGACTSKTIVIIITFWLIITEQFNTHHILWSFIEYAHDM